MGRLKALPARLSALPPRLAASVPMDEAERSRQRDASQSWRKLYKTARWQRLRWSVLVRDLFTCRRCRRVEAITSLLVADHIKPHRGNEVLFWDEGNLQVLCATCHNRWKQQQEKAGWY